MASWACPVPHGIVWFYTIDHYHLRPPRKAATRVAIVQIGFQLMSLVVEWVTKIADQVTDLSRFKPSRKDPMVSEAYSLSQPPSSDLISGLWQQ